MTALVVGADGTLGRALVDRLSGLGETVYETTRRVGTLSDRRVFLDLARDVTAWHPPGPVSVAYLCAGVTTSEQCREHPLESARVNINGTVELTKRLVASGAFIVYPSTNQVYDGSVPFRKASDLPCSQTEYGRQKAEAERQLLALGELVAVVRFAKIVAPDAPLHKQWIETLRNGVAIHPFSDMVLAPVTLSFAVQTLLAVARQYLAGIIQVTGERDVTYEEAARYLAERIGADPQLVQPIRSAEAGLRLEAVPANTTLDTTRLRSELGLNPPHIWSVLDTMVGA